MNTKKNFIAPKDCAPPSCSQSSIIRMGLDMLREEARVIDARLCMAIDHEQQLRKLHESVSDTLAMLRAVKRDIDNRAESILSQNNLVADGNGNKHAEDL